MTDEEVKAWLKKLAAQTPEDYARELLDEGYAELAAVKRVRARFGLGVHAALELVHGVIEVSSGSPETPMRMRGLEPPRGS